MSECYYCGGEAPLTKNEYIGGALPVCHRCEQAHGILQSREKAKRQRDWIISREKILKNG